MGLLRMLALTMPAVRLLRLRGRARHERPTSERAEATARGALIAASLREASAARRAGE